MYTSLSPKFINYDIWEKAHYFSHIRKAVEYFEKHFGEPIDLQKMASIACMERTAFSKCFRRRTGTTLRQFIRAYRISKAAAMIESCDESILQVAFGVGFNNFTAFDRAFKSVTGITPSDYRRKFLSTIISPNWAYNECIQITNNRITPDTY